ARRLPALRERRRSDGDDRHRLRRPAQQVTRDGQLPKGRRRGQFLPARLQLPLHRAEAREARPLISPRRSAADYCRVSADENRAKRSYEGERADGEEAVYECARRGVRRSETVETARRA